MFRGVADHQGVVGDILGNYSAGTDEGVLADGVAANNGAVGAECCAFFYERGTDLVHFSDFRSRVVDVGKNHRRAAEDAAFQGDTFIDADVVLDLAFVADDCVGANDDVLADVAVFTDVGAGEDVGKMPNSRSLTD